MKSVFHWLDQHPGFYAVVAIAALLAVMGLLLDTSRRPVDQWPRRPVRAWLAWAGIFALMLFAWRWPHLLDPKPLNPDEASFVASAIRLEHDPFFWRSIDNTTSGPLASFPLVAMRLLGLPADYFTARLAAILLNGIALAASLLATRRLAGPRAAVAGVLSALVFFAVTVDWDILHYNSEGLPLALMSIGVWLITEAQARHFTGRAWVGAGIFLGLLPWAKLQSVPIGMAIGVWALGWVLLQSSLSWTQRWHRAAVLVGTAVAPTILLLSCYVFGGQLDHWWTSFIIDNLIYARGIPESLGVEKILQMASYTYALHGFFIAPSLLLAVGLSWSPRLHREPGCWLGVLSIAAACYAITASGRGFLHYTMFLFLPVSWLTAVALKGWLERSRTPPPARWRFAALMVLIVTPQLLVRAGGSYPTMLGQLEHVWRFPRNEIAQVITRLKQPGDILGLWGWDPDLSVRTALPTATRETNTERQVRESELRDSYYRKRYLEEFRTSRPAFFVDAVGPNGSQFWDRTTQAHETMPELKAEIAERYVYIGDFRPWRLYLRKDRAMDLDAVRTALVEAARQQPPLNENPIPAVHEYFLPERPRWVIEGREVSMLETPAHGILQLSGDERTLIFDYGMDPRCYQRADQTDGVNFLVRLLVDGEWQVPIWEDLLDPVNDPSDRGFQRGEAYLPPHAPGTQVIIQATPGRVGNAAWDWAFATDFRFRRGPALNYELLGVVDYTGL